MADATFNYQEAVTRAQQEYAESYRDIDGMYSKAQAYAGLVRTELMNAAAMRRDAAMAKAEQDYNEQIEAEGYPDGNES